MCWNTGFLVPFQIGRGRGQGTDLGHNVLEHRFQGSLPCRLGRGRGHGTDLGHSVWFLGSLPEIVETRHSSRPGCTQVTDFHGQGGDEVYTLQLFTV
jgi:hypothetical protein